MLPAPLSIANLPLSPEAQGTFLFSKAGLMKRSKLYLPLPAILFVLILSIAAPACSQECDTAWLSKLDGVNYTRNLGGGTVMTFTIRGCHVICSYRFTSSPEKYSCGVSAVQGQGFEAQGGGMASGHGLIEADGSYLVLIDPRCSIIDEGQRKTWQCPKGLSWPPEACESPACQFPRD